MQCSSRNGKYLYKIGAIFRFSDSLHLLKERKNLIIYDMLRMKDINNKKIKVLTKKTWGLGRISVMSEVSRKTENKFELNDTEIHVIAKLIT